MDYPKTFTDTKGRPWTVEIGWGTFRRVKEKCGIDLDSFTVRKGMSEAQQQDVMERFLGLIYSSVDFPPVLMTILDSQMKAANVSEADFMDGFDTPDTIDAVTKAFRQALADFTRDPLARMVMQKMMLGVDRAQAATMKRLDKETEKILQKVETELEAQIDLALKNTSTDSAGSSMDTIPSNPSQKE